MLLTRESDEVPRAERLRRVVEHLRWRYAKARADCIMRGRDPEDNWNGPATLEAIASDGDDGTVALVRQDLEVVAIELLGLLWRLEDAGVIKPTATIVEAAGLTSSVAS